MKNFNISQYASGTWHLHSVMASIEGSLNGYSCGRLTGKFNRTHISANIKAKQDDKVEGISVSPRIVSNSIFKLMMDTFTYQNFNVYGIDFDVS
jgi:hypothetical protein